MTRTAALAAAAALALAGCSELAPFPTTPAAAKPGVSGVRVAVCADRLASKRAEIDAAAQQQCPPHTRATFVATDWWLQHCPLLVPGRSTYRCAPVK